MNALPMPSSSATSDVPGLRLARGEIADHLRALLGRGAQRFGERDGIVGWVRAASGAARVLAVADMVVAFEVRWKRGSDYPAAGANRIDAVRVDATVELRRAPQIIEMGDRLAHREIPLLDVELAAEKHGNEIGSAERCGGRAHRVVELGEPRLVMRPELRDAQRDPAERQPVRRQHQRVGRQVGERGERIEEAPQRIAVRIDGARR